MLTGIQSGYWSAAEYDAGDAWFFLFLNGDQNWGREGGSYYGWAVRPGDVWAVPEPGSAVLLGLGLAGLGLARRRWSKA